MLRTAVRRVGTSAGASATVRAGARNIPRRVTAQNTISSTRGLRSTAPRAAEPAVAEAPPPEKAQETDKVDLLEVYRGLVASGRLTWDDEQVRVVMKLRHLFAELRDYEPPLHLLAKLGPTPPLPRSTAQKTVDRARSWWSSEEDPREMALVKVLSGEEEIEALDTPKGILLTGPPGTGKSFLLSLLYDALPARKARHHYHAFTLWIYQRVFAETERRRNAAPEGHSTRNMEVAGVRGWRSVFAGGRYKSADEDAAVEEPSYADPRDTIPFVIAKEMILDYHVLYFDEMQLVDASSAALIRDVLSWYWRLGGVVLSCSNRVPDDLYHHGVQRDRMAGFLDALKSRCEVVQLDGGRDFRRIGEMDPDAPRRWMDLEDPSFEASWEAESNEPAAPRDLVVYGRRLTVPHVKGNAARFDFEELCETSLGPADYLTLASSFETFYLDNIPVLLLRHKNEARRLINLIDALYESRCKIAVRAAAQPEHLFFPDALDPSLDPEQHAFHDALEAEALSESLAAQPRANVSVYNPQTRAERERQDHADLGSSFSVMSIFTGEDERFAYKRAVSRLIEMSTSPAYAAEPWLPLDPNARGWEAHSGPVTGSARRSVRHGTTIIGGKDDGMAREIGSRSGARPDLDEILATGGSKEDVEERAESLGGPREGAPRIRDVHAWGVEEWGPRAGRWGQGTRVYDEEGTEGQAEGRLRWRRGGEK